MGIISGPIWGSFAVRDHLRSWDHLILEVLGGGGGAFNRYEAFIGEERLFQFT